MNPVLLQRVGRGYLERNHREPEHDKYRIAQALCKRAFTGAFPKASAGAHPVYLPTGTGIVLKYCQRESAIERLTNMETVRSILEKENCSRLVVPKAFLCGEFVIEERLPIHDCDYENMWIYHANREAFDETVRELVRLFSKVTIGDIVDSLYNSFCTNYGIEEAVRYDNFSLYMLGKEGRVGLIDLEWVTKRPNSREIENNLALIGRIFHYHEEIIKEEASKIHLPIDLKLLNRSIIEGNKFLEVEFLEHYEWLKTKQTTCAFPISQEKIEELSHIFNADNDLFFVDQELKKTVVPTILNRLNDAILSHQNKIRETLSLKDPTPAQEVRMRSCHIHHIDILERNEQTISTITTATEFILNALIKSGTIHSFYWKPNPLSLAPILLRF